MTKPGKHRHGPHEGAATPESPAAPADESGLPVPAEAAAPPPAAAPPAAPSEAEVLKDRLLRLAADFENYRKRAQRERNEVLRRACQDVLTDALPVVDHLELALRHADGVGGGTAFVEGVELVLNQLRAVLRKYGAEPIPAVGTPFDPQFHEAVLYQPSEEHPEGCVIAQTRSGYRLGEVVLRPAQVIVSSGPAAVAAEEGGE